jgi:hypothetical protein
MAAIIALLIVALVTLCWIYLPARHPGFLSLGAEECRGDYRQARTAADTARIDLIVPATGGQKGWTAQRCGLLRTSGAVR